MKRTTCLLTVLTVFGVFLAETVHAGVFGRMRSFVTGEVSALFLSGVVVLLGGVFGTMFRKITLTFREAGEFLTVLGDALEDQRLTRDELTAIVRHGRDVFRVWG